MKKRAIRYVRFSDRKQSESSIERQILFTDNYIKYNEIELTDTFIDRGFSARTFDRPDFNKLSEFVQKHHRTVDYLIVDQMDRFSRDAGEALVLAKKLQAKYNISIVSVTEGIVFDYNTPGSFFRTGLQLLLAEDDNINRSNKVNRGIYTNKRNGRYIFKSPPFGYMKVGYGKEMHIVIKEDEAEAIRFIFDAFLKDVPIYKIAEMAKEIGYNRSGNVAIQRVLTQPVYAGMQSVKPFKELPGGLFPAQHEAIIDLGTWEMVQQKMQKPAQPKVMVTDDLPLRGVIKCSCGLLLTGAASRGSKGVYYHYYKCNVSRHLNLSANKAHNQMLEIQQLMSLPKSTIKEIRSTSDTIFEKKIVENKKLVEQKRVELDAEEEKLVSIEEKWILNQITYDTYDRWFHSINTNKIALNAAIERLSRDQNNTYNVLQRNLDKLTDMRYVYEVCDTLEKQALIKIEFDNNLYYEGGSYRTPTMLDELAHNHLIMKEKGLLVYDKKRENLAIPPSSGPDGTRTRDLRRDRAAF